MKQTSGSIGKTFHPAVFFHLWDLACFLKAFFESDDLIMKSCIEIILCMHFLKKWTLYTMLYAFICSYTGTANVFSMLMSRGGTCPNFISLTCTMYFVQFEEHKYCAILYSCGM